MQPSPLSLPPLSPSFYSPTRLTFPHIELLGIPIHLVSPAEILRAALHFMNDERPHHIVTANSLFILEAQRALDLAKICAQASLVLPDSAGISWAARQLNLQKPLRIPGIDLAYQLCSLAEFHSKPVY